MIYSRTTIYIYMYIYIYIYQIYTSYHSLVIKSLPFGDGTAAPSNYKRHLAIYHHSSLHLSGGAPEIPMP